MFTNFATYLPNDLEHFFPGDTFPAYNVLCFIAPTIQWLILVNMGILGQLCPPGCSYTLYRPHKLLKQGPFQCHCLQAVIEKSL